MSRPSIELVTRRSSTLEIAPASIITGEQSGVGIIGIPVDHTAPTTKDEVQLPDGPGSRGKTAIIITCVTCITGIGSFLAGTIVVAIPTIGAELDLGPDLILWPVSIYSLTCGCTLLICGTVADVVGNRSMYLAGCLLQAVFTLACGLSKSGLQLIVIRGLSGVAASFCLPSAVSIINDAFPPSRSRNMAFASMGGGQPVGFGLGLVLGGVFAETIEWRWGFYIAAIVNVMVLGFSMWQLPTVSASVPFSWNRLAYEIDWMGAFIASSCLALLSYALALLTGSSASVRSSGTLTTLCIAVLLIPAFFFWMNRQQRLNRPALIPNTVWRNRVFTSICINVFLIWGAFNALEQMVNFFFQNVQNLTPLEAAVRFLPTPISGALANVLVGVLIPHVRADWMVITTTVISCIAPLLLAIANPDWTYWAMAFPAIFFNPLGADGLFTISNLLITSVFPTETQGLAGGVFNTVSQIGKSVGLSFVGLISYRMTQASGVEDKQSRAALLEGYRASFWFIVRFVRYQSSHERVGTAKNRDSWREERLNERPLVTRGRKTTIRSVVLRVVH